MPSASEIPTGCPFHTRCPRFLGQQCVEQVPPWQQTGDGHAYRCWIPPEELTELQARAGRHATGPNVANSKYDH